MNKLKTSCPLKVKPGTLHIFGTINTYVPTIPLHLGYLNLNDDVIISYFWYLGLFCETRHVSQLRISDPLRIKIYTLNICDKKHVGVIHFYYLNSMDRRQSIVFLEFRPFFRESSHLWHHVIVCWANFYENSNHYNHYLILDMIVFKLLCVLFSAKGEPHKTAYYCL